MNVGDKRALITGGGSGIGLDLARRLVAAGADVVIAGRDEARLARGRYPQMTMPQ